MKGMTLRSPSMALALFVALLSACSGTSSTLTGAPPNVTFARHAHSWMAPGASGRNLLYVADPGIGAVVVYTYLPGPIGFVGLLSGASSPEGECVDAAQNLWVTGSYDVLFEYPHGATSPSAILSDPLGATSCSVDPMTGNLATVNGSVSDEIAIFKHAQGPPKVIADAAFHQVNACAYDASGNLFVDGLSNSETFTFAELVKGARHFRPIVLNQTFSEPGDVRWDGKYVVVDDPRGAVLYRFSISGGTGTEVGSTPINGAGYLYHFFVEGDRAIAPFQDDQGSFVNLYKYPAGGFRSKSLPNFSTPRDAVVSLAPGNRATAR